MTNGEVRVEGSNKGVNGVNVVRKLSGEGKTGFKDDRKEIGIGEED